ncbi:MAG: Zn-ribbon containing protein [Candidatus Woesearchaeota archaeon]
MPHQCTACGILYDDGAQAIVNGCSCGGKFFFFIKKEQLQEKKQLLALSPKEKKQIEDDVYDILGMKKEQEPVVLDLEAIKISEPGKYEVDLVKLMGNKPVIYRLGDGKYIIDLAESFAKAAKTKKGTAKK